VWVQCARLGDIRSNHEPTVTYEGDNNVLSQQAGNWLVRQYAAAASAAPLDAPLGSVAFLAHHRAIARTRFRCTSTAQLKTPECECLFAVNTALTLIRYKIDLSK
jgi:acyl-CoA oxidase